jgi:poly(hydroxyalkanoate) granule-associated protein
MSKAAVEQNIEAVEAKTTDKVNEAADKTNQAVDKAAAKTNKAVRKVADTANETADKTGTVLSDVKVYARKIWLAGLGAYAKAGQEGAEYFKELVKNGESVEQQGKKLIDEQVEAANSQIDTVKSNVSSVKNKVEGRLDKIEKAFDTRVASALNRIGIPSKHDIEVLSAKLDELSALLEQQVAQTKK